MPLFQAPSSLLSAVGDNWIAFAAVFGVALVWQLYLFTRPRSPRGGKQWLDPAEFKPLAISEKRFLNHNTLFLRFNLSSPTMRLGLPIGQHISFLVKGEDGKDVYRSYTPVSDDDQLGSVDFVIKIYDQGKMTQVLNKLNVGDAVQMKGPKGRLQYVPNMKAHFGMVCGGTGITPMYQVVNAILKNPRDKTKVSLIYGSITEEDILLRKELDVLAQAHPGRFKVLYVLDKPPAGWTGGSGYITADLMRAHLPAPGPSTLTLRCGPLPMMDAMKKNLDAVGHAVDAQFQF